LLVYINIGNCGILFDDSIYYGFDKYTYNNDDNNIYNCIKWCVILS